MDSKDVYGNLTYRDMVTMMTIADRFLKRLVCASAIAGALQI